MSNQLIEQRVADLLAKMTLREKIGQLNQLRNPINQKEELLEKIRRGEIGAFLTEVQYQYQYNDQESRGAEHRKYLNELQRAAVEESRLGIPILCGRDVIHGYNTMYPNLLAMAATFNPELVTEAYRCTAKEAANDGIRWSFAPMVDMSRDPRWGRCVEGPGEDPYLGAQMAAAAVKGFQGDDLSKRDSIAACAKHYIGYGASEGGRDYHKAEISDYSLRNYYLPAFKGAVDAGVRSVMSSFNEVSGQPTTSSHYLLTEILKEELGFDGFIVSDDYSVIQLKRQGVAETDAEAAMMAINAGLDMNMSDQTYINNLEQLVANGKVKEETINEAVRRILRVKFELGLFENPYVEYVPVDEDYHMSVARKIAGESVILLKNEGGLLPLDPKEPITLVGPMVHEKASHMGAWACNYDLGRVKSIYEAIKVISPDTPVSENASIYYDVTTMCVRNLDTIVMVLGESAWVTGEGSGMTRIELPEEQQVLVKKMRGMGMKIIAVLCCGRPLALGDIEPYFDAIVYAWHNGTETGTAVADVLFGNVSPSGKVPMTLLRESGQIPLYYNEHVSGRDVDGYYGIERLQNYRNCLGTPLYPFGYGLSYTEFSFSDLEAVTPEKTSAELDRGDAFEIQIKVKNVGKRAGKEVVQCYVRDKIASMTRPTRELKGFEKIYLEPGEEKTITFRLSRQELGFWGADKIFRAEPGEFDVYVGNSSLAKDCVTIRLV